MESTTFFEGLLGLSSPYSISKIEHKLSEEAGVHIYVEVEDDYRPVNNHGITGTKHDIEERKWRHLDLFQYHCYIHCEVPKFKYGRGTSSYVETLVVPWSRPNSGFTLLFEELVVNFVKLHGCVSRVAKQVKEYPQRLQTIINFYEPLECSEEVIIDESVEKSSEDVKLKPLVELVSTVEVESDELAGVTTLNIDETSRKKGHDYVTNFLDGQTGKVLDIQRGKGAKVIERFVEKGLAKGLNPAAITDISIDMSPSFICGCETYFVQAAISFDKFHVSQLVNRCFDEFRKSQAKILGKRLPKWSIIKPIEQLNSKEQKEMNEMLEQLPQLEEFHQHKNIFAQLWQYEIPEQGAIFLAFWIGRVEEMGTRFNNKKMLTLVKTLNNHFERIINVLKSGMDNAISEAFNNNVQIMKRVARGYKTFEQFIQMIKLHCDLAR